MDYVLSNVYMIYTTTNTTSKRAHVSFIEGYGVIINLNIQKSIGIGILSLSGENSF